MSIVDNAKEIAKLVKKYNDQELYEKIVNLREQILALREDNLKLKEQIKKIEAAGDIEKKIIREGNCYYFADDSDRKNPYCIPCWDYEKKLVGLIIGQGTIKCYICMSRKNSS